MSLCKYYLYYLLLFVICHGLPSVNFNLHNEMYHSSTTVRIAPHDALSTRLIQQLEQRSCQSAPLPPPRAQEREYLNYINAKIVTNVFFVVEQQLNKETFMKAMKSVSHFFSLLFSPSFSLHIVTMNFNRAVDVQTYSRGLCCCFPLESSQLDDLTAFQAPIS